MQEDPNFEQRLLLAFALAVILFLVVMPYIARHSTPPPAAHPPAQTAVAPASTAPAPAPVPPPSTGAKPAAVAAAAAQTIVIDTPVYHVVLSNRGAAVQSWVLKQYRDDSGLPLNLVDADFDAHHPAPLVLWTPDPTLRAALDDNLYAWTRTTSPDGMQWITFHWSDGHTDVVKRLGFGAGYVVTLIKHATSGGQALPTSWAWEGAFADRSATGGDFGSEQLVYDLGDKLTTVKASKVDDGASRQADYHFVGVQDQYFAAVFLSANPQAPLVMSDFKTADFQPAWTGTSRAVTTVGLAAGGPASDDLTLFAGPKKIDLLKSVDPQLRGLVDFGWFSFLADPLFLWMNWTYNHWIHNYGWTILFITLVITMALMPLRIKAQKSQAKMTALQPQVNAINQRMKKYPARDPRKMEAQQEIMQLYSKNGVNPLGGCLPMLIPFPLIIAFYEMLEHAIELRQAPWIGYIHDLSAKDPYYILPLLLVVTQFFAIQMSPSGQDPRQARMMKWVMPLFMGYIFFFLPSGVNLYYLGNMSISVVQQWYINRKYAIRPLGSRRGTKQRATV